MMYQITFHILLNIVFISKSVHIHFLRLCCLFSGPSCLFCAAKRSYPCFTLFCKYLYDLRLEVSQGVVLKALIFYLFHFLYAINENRQKKNVMTFKTSCLFGSFFILGVFCGSSMRTITM